MKQSDLLRSLFFIQHARTARSGFRVKTEEWNNFKTKKSGQTV
jgi:hypothetical protein